MCSNLRHTPVLGTYTCRNQAWPAAYNRYTCRKQAWPVVECGRSRLNAAGHAWMRQVTPMCGRCFFLVKKHQIGQKWSINHFWPPLIIKNSFAKVKWFMQYCYTNFDQIFTYKRMYSSTIGVTFVPLCNQKSQKIIFVK